MPRVAVNGFSIHYQSVGEGPDLVMIHGLSGDLAAWHPAVVHKLASEYHVIRMDLRGHGRSGSPPAGYTTRQMAGDLLSLMDALGLERPHLIGHSFGGAVALHCAILHPERVASMTLADVRVRSLQSSQGMREWVYWQSIQHWLSEHGVEIGVEDAEADFHLLERLARLRVEGRLEDLKLGPFFIPFASGSVRRAEHWVRLMDETTALEDFKNPAGLTAEAIAGLPIPALLLYGELSHCLPTMEALQGLLPSSQSGVVEGAGHFHPMIKPQEFLDRVGRFLVSVQPRRILPASPADPARPRPHGDRAPRLDA